MIARRRSSIIWAAPRSRRTGARVCCRTAARCTTRWRTPTGRYGRSSPDGRPSPRTATAGRTSGEQALMANALLTYTGALGYVTELLSGDFATAFGRSSHHQIWSEAMVVTPTVRGLLGIETTDAGATLRVAPTLPASWDRVAVHSVRVKETRYDVTVERGPGRAVMRVTRDASASSTSPVR